MLEKLQSPRILGIHNDYVEGYKKGYTAGLKVLDACNWSFSFLRIATSMRQGELFEMFLEPQAGAGAQGMVRGSAAGYTAMMSKLRARNFY